MKTVKSFKSREKLKRLVSLWGNEVVSLLCISTQPPPLWYTGHKRHINAIQSIQDLLKWSRYNLAMRGYERGYFGTRCALLKFKAGIVRHTLHSEKIEDCFWWAEKNRKVLSYHKFEFSFLYSSCRNWLH